MYYAGFGAFVLSAVEFLTGVWHYSAVLAGLAIAPGPLMVLPFARVVAPRLAAWLGGPGRVAVIGCAVNAGAQLLWLYADPGPAGLPDPPAARSAAGRRRGRPDDSVTARRGEHVADAGEVRHRQRDPEHGAAGRHRARGGRAGGHLVPGVGADPVAAYRHGLVLVIAFFAAAGVVSAVLLGTRAGSLAAEAPVVNGVTERAATTAAGG